MPVLRVPPLRKTVVEGGHFTLRQDAMGRDVAALRFLVRCDAGAPAMPFEFLRGSDPKDRGREWAVLLLDTPKTLKQLGVTSSSAWPLEPPSDTELATMRRAILLAREMREAGEDVEISLLIGDLLLAPGLRASTEWMLPEAYVALLDEFGMRPEEITIVKESTARSRGAHIVLKKLTSRNGESSDNRDDSRYGERGFGVARDEGHELFLFADHLLDERMWPFPVIALTKGVENKRAGLDSAEASSSKPSCAVTLAGRLDNLMRAGVVRHISFHDTADDPQIRHKAIEGIAVAAHFGTAEADMLCEVFTQDGLRKVQDEVQLSRLRAPGRRESFDALAAEASGPSGLEFVGDGVTSTCCPPNRTRS